MAYRLDPYDSSLVIDGWEQGIADSPHTGISDMRNCNIISVPNEASVNFATQSLTTPSFTSVVTSLNTGANTFTCSPNASLENGMAVKFSSVGSITGISTNTPYWVGSASGTNFQLYTDWSQTSLAVLGGTSAGSPTFTPYLMSQPKYFTRSLSNDYMVDSAGLVWSNKTTTASGFWIYTGNTTLTNANGNGLVYYQASDLTGFIFVFRNSLIDYLPTTGVSPTWVYGWNPLDASTANTGTKLKTAAGTNNSHEAFVAPTNQVIFCDANWVGRFYENNPATPFVPTSAASFVYDQTELLPATDLAQCLTYLGTNILVGGKNNIIYPWNGTATTFNYPVLLPEYDIKKMITVNTTTYILVGNRGRIYYTNGTNVNLFKKIPDHISGTVEPYFTWGGLCSTKNQIYFSASVTTNGGVAINQYGGVWAIDVDTKAIRLANKLSYATYAGKATALMPNFSSNPGGTGLYIGWDDGASGYGLDITISTPYTGSQATIDTDLIPIGTFTKPRDFTKIEYKLTKPMVSGESIIIQTRLIFNTTDTGFTTTLTDSTAGNFSGSSDINFANAQWVQFKIILNSTATTPSYMRLKNIRIMGLTSGV